MSEINVSLERYITMASKCKLLETKIKNLNNKDVEKSIQSILNSAEYLRKTFFDNLVSTIEQSNKDDVDSLINKVKSEIDFDERNNLDINNATYFRYFVCEEFLKYLEKFEAERFIK